MSGVSVLIVDDTPANVELLAFVLETNGYLVRSVVNAEAALVAIGEAAPRVILLDLRLPGMDGWTLARHLKTDPSTRHIAIIAITASAMKGDEERALAAGCDGYITKPIDTRQLPAQIAALLHGT